MHPLVELVRRIVFRETVHLGTYGAEVLFQHDDDTLDLMPEDKRVRGNGLQRVPIRHGLPGVRVRVAQGSHVELAFENGDPTKPFAHLWDPGSVEEISFDGGTREIARNGDPVELHWPAACQITGNLGPLPFQGVITIVSPSMGIIAGGKDNVLA